MQETLYVWEDSIRRIDSLCSGLKELPFRYREYLKHGESYINETQVNYSFDLENIDTLS